jgi:hypothetical protein
MLKSIEQMLTKGVAAYCSICQIYNCDILTNKVRFEAYKRFPAMDKAYASGK